MKTIIPIASLFVALLSLGSCDLDRDTDQYIEYDKSYRNLQDAKQWDNGLYASLRGKFGGAYVYPQEAQADMLSPHALVGSTYTLFYNWRVQTNDETFKALYHSYYAALVDANIIIGNIPKLTAQNAEEQAQLNIFKGNAHFARAFYYFNLAIRWGEVYQHETAATDLCVPLRTEPFKIDKSKRASNEAVYKQILSDLDEAERLLSQVPLKVGNKEISSDAVIALRSRVYLYMGQMAEALATAQRLIDSHRYPLVPALTAGKQDAEGKDHPFVRMWHYDSGEEQIWQPYVKYPNETSNTTNLYGADLDTYQYFAERGLAPRDYNRPPYLPTGTVLYELFHDDKDRRLPAYFEYVTTTLQQRELQADVFVVSKFKGNPQYSTIPSNQWGGYCPNGVAAPKPFRIAEQYLIASEAAYEVGQASEALKYLTALRLSRGLSTEQGLSGEELRNAIRDERTRELAYEGYRLWDLRRWRMGFGNRVRQGLVQEHQVSDIFFGKGYEPDGGKVEADNPKFVWPFPQEEAGEINKNIKQNKGWD